MKVNIVSSKLIKPCTSTPPSLNQHKLSLIDETVPPINLTLFLFYNPTTLDNIPKHTRVRHLQQSLSEILPQFYLVAGRYIKSDHLIDCSDQGVEFIEAEVVDDDVAFIDLVSKMEHEELNSLSPCERRNHDEAPTDPLMSIQITEFKCGGLAITVSVSHRIFDASSVGTFIVAWSNANNNPGGETTIFPSFESPSLFPRVNPGPDPGLPSLPLTDRSIVVKRFSFTKDAIANLRRSKLISTNYYSRVRVVSAIITQVLIGLDQARHGGKLRPCHVAVPVNFRGRTIPPLPKHSCGNLMIVSLARFNLSEEKEIVGIQEVSDVLADGLEKTFADCAQMFSPGGCRDRHSIIVGSHVSFFQVLLSGEVNVVAFSDWSKFGFYEVDFGWGKPVGVGTTGLPGEKVTVLMNNKDGDGMEAWVHLTPEDMVYFEQDEDIKLYTI